MPSKSENLSLICLEVPWTTNFGASPDGFTPESSILPYAKAHFSDPKYRVLHRSLNSKNDLSMWCSGIKKKHIDRRVVWITGHGDGVRTVKVQLPSGQVISPAQIGESLESAGPMDGVIVDACSFGKNGHHTWLSRVNSQWALAFANDVYWTDSMFFVLKTMDWLYGFDAKPPKNSADFCARFDKGLRTGRTVKSQEIDLRGWATSLGAQFYYRKQKSSWSAYKIQ